MRRLIAPVLLLSLLLLPASALAAGTLVCQGGTCTGPLAPLSTANTWTALQTFSAGLTVSGGQVLVPNGTSSVFSYAFSGSNTTGMFRASSGSLILGAVAQSVSVNANDGLVVRDAMYLGWNADGNISGGFNPVLRLYQDAANTLAQRNSTNAQAFSLYKTFTDASNYERLKIWADAGNNVFRIDPEAAGTGTVRNIAFMAGNIGIGTTAIASGQKVEINGGLNLTTATAQPGCTSTTRGTFWVVQNGAGVKDQVEACAKDAADAYAWRVLY